MSLKSFLDITHKYQEAINNINESIKYHKILDLNKNNEINELFVSLSEPIFYDKYISLKKKYDMYNSMISNQCVINYLI